MTIQDKKPVAKKPAQKKPTPPKEAKFNLRLTSPHMRGRQVEIAQHRLHNNKYGEFYKPSHTDGIYGPETAASTRHAKWALGFPEKEVNQNYDDPLDVRLSGERPLGSAYENRRQLRRAPKQVNIKAKAADIAVKNAGYHEGSNNNNKFGSWYGMNNAPWCAMFVSYCNVTAGDKTVFVKGQRYSYVPNIFTDAMHGEHGMSFTSHPEKGDLALFHFSGGEYPVSHVGIVLSLNPWRWISGNFSDQVLISTADRSSVVKFVRLPH